MGLLDGDSNFFLIDFHKTFGVRADELVEWFTLMVNAFPPDGLRSFDVHDGNFGFRKNGELVIFDPISDTTLGMEW